MGVYCYNYNLNIYVDNYDNICFMYGYEDWVDMVIIFKKVGLLFCFGVIFGMGEINE